MKQILTQAASQTNEVLTNTKVTIVVGAAAVSESHWSGYFSPFIELGNSFIGWATPVLGFGILVFMFTLNGIKVCKELKALSKSN